MLLNAKHEPRRSQAHRRQTRNAMRSTLNSIGIDQIVDEVVAKLGYVDEAYVTGDFAVGKNGKTIDILLIGIDIDKDFLHRLIDKAESLINRKIRYLILSPSEAEAHLGDRKGAMLIWKMEL